MNKLKLISIILTVCFAISLVFNVYFLYDLARLHDELAFYRYRLDQNQYWKENILEYVEVYWNNWDIFPKQNPVYCAVANFKIVNYGEVSAYIVVAIEVRHQGQAFYEWFETGEGSQIAVPVIRYEHYEIPTHEERNCSMRFYFLNPENLDTYLFISVIEAFPIS